MMCKDLGPREVWRGEDFAIDSFIVEDGPVVDDFARSKSSCEILVTRCCQKFQCHPNHREGG